MKTETKLNLEFTIQNNEGVYQSFLVYCGHNWGRGTTLNEAIKAAKVHPAHEFTAMLFTSDKPFEVWVGDSGNWIYETEQEGEVVKSINLGKIKVWFQPEDIIYDLWTKLFDEVKKEDLNAGYNFEQKTSDMLYKYFKD